MEDSWIIEQNIARFQRLLSRDSLSARHRATLEKLLAEERRKLDRAVPPEASPPGTFLS